MHLSAHWSHCPVVERQPPLLAAWNVMVSSRRVSFSLYACDVALVSSRLSFVTFPPMCVSFTYRASCLRLAPGPPRRTALLLSHNVFTPGSGLQRRILTLSISAVFSLQGFDGAVSVAAYPALTHCVHKLQSSSRHRRRIPTPSSDTVVSLGQAPALRTSSQWCVDSRHH